MFLEQVGTQWPFQDLPFFSDEIRRYGDDLIHPRRAHITIDGKMLPFSEFTQLHAGAIDINLGGVFRFFPLAREFGHIHFQAGSAPLRDCILNLPNMFAGRAMNTDFMWEGRGHVMDIHADQGDTIDPVIDGELFQGLRQLTITRGPEVEVPQLS